MTNNIKPGDLVIVLSDGPRSGRDDWKGTHIGKIYEVEHLDLGCRQGLEYFLKFDKDYNDYEADYFGREEIELFFTK
jgi:hypothetical protein